MSEVSTKPQRTGQGAIVPRRYELEFARREFFAALWELVPEALDAIFEMDREGQGRRAEEARGWQATYHLPDEWGRKATLIPPAVEDYFFDLGAASVYEGRERIPDWERREFWWLKSLDDSPDAMRSGMARESDSYIVLLAHLLYESPEGDTERPGDVEIGSYDPRAETGDDATKRLLPELERRLRYGLQMIKAQDRAGDTVPTRSLPSRQHFEWAVRYQVLGENYSEIARAERVEQKTVRTNVHAVADLIGLTLRSPDKGGAPAGKRQRRRPRTIAIRHQP